MIVTISEVIIRINSLALKSGREVDWRLNLWLNMAPTPDFTIADAFFSSAKNVSWQVSLSLSQSGYCSVASSYVDSGSFSQVWSCACVNGYFQTENSGILKRAEGTVNCNFALWSNWIKKVDTLSFTHQWKDLGSHVLHSECSFFEKNVLPLFKSCQQIFILCFMGFYI